MEETSTLTQVTSGMPKVVDAKTHAVLDYLTAGSFFVMGFSMRHHKRAAGLAFANGAAV